MSEESGSILDDRRVRALVGGALAGAAVTRVVSIVLPIHLGGLLLHLSLPALIMLCVQVNELLTGREESLSPKVLAWVGGAVGVILDETLWLVVRNPPLAADAPAQVAYWSVPSLSVAVLGLLLFAGGVLAAARAWPDREEMPALQHRHLGIAAGVLIGGLVFFHVSQALIRYDVANEDRSLLILGYEIHHLVEGQILLFAALVMMVFAGGRVWPWRLSFGFVLVGVLFVSDEILYYQFADVSDAAYFGAATIVSGGLMSLLMLAQLLMRSDALSAFIAGESDD